MASEPSKIYTRAIVDMTGGFERESRAEIHGIAHITGGGIPGKLGRLLSPYGLGADIEDPFEPNVLMTLCQGLGEISSQEAYKTWNMGHGMVIATNAPENVINIANKHDISARAIGKITSKPEINIVNMGMYKEQEPTLTFST